jgi:hypothetical protein
VTSEPQRLADDAKNDWKFSFEAFGDPHHEIVSSCRERGWLDLIINPKTDTITGQENSKFSHPKGYFQPGVLAVDKSGRVLYRWRGVPTRSNMGGAVERPTADHVFEQVSRGLNASAPDAAQDAELDLEPTLDSRGIPWPLFVSVLVANGWFIRPRPFDSRPGGPPIKRRFISALLRIPVFVGVWIAAFSLLPATWVCIALLAWAAWLTPGIRYINDQFQNVKTP